MFVSDRKFDEELSQTSRFVCDHDAMMEVSMGTQILFLTLYLLNFSEGT